MTKITRTLSGLVSGGLKGHFGQWAEDVLVRKLFPKHKNDGVYLDLGCYHPFRHSNTAYFWMNGWTGCNVDANAETIKIFKKIRPQDVNVWFAIVPDKIYEQGTREVFFYLGEKTDQNLGVVAKGTADLTLGEQRGFANKQSVPAVSVSKLIRDLGITKVDYLNIDIEGYDEVILQEIDFSVINPTVVSVEDYSDSLETLTTSSITKIMKQNNYDLVGRAGPTSIFIKR